MIKRKLHMIFLLLLPFVVTSQNQDNEIFEAIKQNNLFEYGGTNIITIDGKSYIVSVSSVAISPKNRSSLMRIGKVKADRNLATFINGSNITSKTESYVKEELTTVNDSSYLVTIDSFVEYIREDTKGFINGMRTAGYWYSNDNSLFLYAIYKEVNLK